MFITAPNSSLSLHKQTRHKMCNPAKQNEAPDSVFLNMFAEVRVIYADILPLDNDLRDYYLLNINVSQSKIAAIEKRTRFQNNDMWKRERKYRITASRAHTLCSYNGRNWDLKIASFLASSQFKSAAMIYGSKTEETARICYENQTNCVVARLGLVINADQPWLGCSPDGYIVNKNKLIEIKCPYNGKHLNISEMLQNLKYLDTNFKIKTTHAYFTQMQISMAVMNVNSCDFIIYSKHENKCHIETVNMDVNFIKTKLVTLKYI